MIKPSPPRGMSTTQIHDARTDYSTVPDELRAEISRLQAENERLKEIEVKYHWNRQQDWGDDAAKYYKQRYEEKCLELHTAEQRVARDILEKMRFIDETTISYEETWEKSIDHIKQKYHIED